MQRTLAVAVMVIGLIAAHSAVHQSVWAQGGFNYLVRITNLTNAQRFTPILAATHASGVRMFLAGTSASPELQALAETGAVSPLMTLLSGNAGVMDMQATAGLLRPGVSTKFEIMGGGAQNRLSLAAMLIPTNDAFVGLNTTLPTALGQEKVVYAFAYDAGTEQNDELCASIPGPGFMECGGPGGGGSPGNGEGAVVIHRGIQGVGDFNAAERDWRNPVARVMIRRIS